MTRLMIAIVVMMVALDAVAQAPPGPARGASGADPFGVPGAAQSAPATDPFTAPGATTTATEPGVAPSGNAPAPNDQFRVTVFTLRNMRATEALRVVREIFDRNIDSVSADERTNSVIVRSLPQRQSVLDQIDVLLVRLDEAEQKLATAGLPRPGEGGGGWAAPQATPPAKIDELKGRYDAREEAAAALAAKIRELQAAAKPNKGEIEKQMKQLRSAVSEAFAARQELHRVEVTQLQQRIETIRDNVATRERISEQIIDRRVKDLLNPSLQWDSAAGSGSRPLGGTPPATGSTPIPSVPGSGRPKVTVGWWSPESEEMLKSLGLQFQKLTRDDAPEPRLVGALKITAISPDSLAKELQVGDVIFTMQTTGQIGGGRRVVIYVRRGAETFPLTVEFPQASWSSVSQKETPGKDLAAARAYRDKLRERMQLLEQRFKNGEAPLVEVLTAQVQLDEAEFAAAANADERRAARQQKIDHLKEKREVFQRLVQAGEATQDNLLAGEAALLKAEAELAAEERGPERATEGNAEGPATTLLPQSSGGQAVILRSADEFRKDLREAEDALANIKALAAGADPTRKGYAITQRQRESAEKNVPSWERRMKWVRDQYDAQLRLLELEVKDAQSAFDAAAKKRDRLVTIRNSGVVPSSVVTEAERETESTTLRLERAKTLLELYRKADPKNREAVPAASYSPPAAEK